MANALRNVDPVAVTICKTGANGKRFFLRKMEEGETAVSLPTRERLIKGDDDWSVVYCVVAEPGAEEQRGMIMKGGELVLDENMEPDYWENEDEIRAASHRFMKNGPLVTEMHKSLSPYGDLVESAVALEDTSVNGETIKKGSWYVGIEPNDHGKEAIESGEFTGVSLEGTGERVPVVKSAANSAPQELGFSGKTSDGGEFNVTFKKSSGLFGMLKDAITGNSIATTPARMTHNGNAIGTESGTVETTPQEDSNVADDKRIEAVEGKVDTLAKSVDGLAERLGKVLDAAESKKAPTVEDLAKSLDDVSGSVEKIAKGLDALAEGASTQGRSDSNGRKELTEDEAYARTLLGVE